MKSAVFDTNVVVAGMLSPHGPPGRIVDGLRSGELKAVLDDRIFAEYEEVLTRPSLGLPRDEVRIVLEAIRRRAQPVDAGAGATVDDLPDPDDAPFLVCARAADVCLVTGNLRHFPARVAKGVQVLTPAAYVKQLPEGNPTSDF